MDEGTFRSTPTVHPMERRSKFFIADENNADICIHPGEENCELLKMKRRKSEGRLPLRPFNRSKRHLKGTTDRKLRTVKKAWGTFKSKINPKSKRRPSREWTASLATPKTPSTRQQIINSPLPNRPSPLTTDSASVKSPGWRLYRNFDKTPSTPKSPYSKVHRRSERIAGRNKTPVSGGENLSTSRRRISIGASPEGTLNSGNTSTMSIDVSAAFQEVINRMEALTEGLATFEKMSSSLTESIKAQDSKVEPPEEKTSASKSLRRQSSSFLRRSLRLHVS